MFDEEGNGDVKTQELERMMSLTGINPTKSELIQMAKDVDKEDTCKIPCYGNKNPLSYSAEFLSYP